MTGYDPKNLANIEDAEIPAGLNFKALLRPKTSTPAPTETIPQPASPTSAAILAGESSTPAQPVPPVSDKVAAPKTGEQPVAKRTTRQSAAPRAGKTGSKQPAKNPVVASNVHIPARLVTLVGQARDSLGLSNGEIITLAISTTFDDLPDLIRGRRPGAGSLFETRAHRRPSKPAEELAPLSFRLTGNDVVQIDRMCADLGATSRGDLIGTALDEYFIRYPIT